MDIVKVPQLSNSIGYLNLIVSYYISTPPSTAPGTVPYHLVTRRRNRTSRQTNQRHKGHQSHKPKTKHSFTHASHAVWCSSDRCTDKSAKARYDRWRHRRLRPMSESGFLLWARTTLNISSTMTGTDLSNA